MSCPASQSLSCPASEVGMVSCPVGEYLCVLLASVGCAVLKIGILSCMGMARSCLVRGAVVLLAWVLCPEKCP